MENKDFIHDIEEASLQVSVINIGNETIKIDTKFDLIQDSGKENFQYFLAEKAYETSLEYYKANYNEAEVAVKILEYSESEFIENKQKIQKEIALMKCLHHPNLANYYGYKFEENKIIIVMELFQGDSLNYYFGKKLLKYTKQKLKIARDIAAGLFHLHSKGIIHRNLASKNIFFSHKIDNETSPILAKIVDYKNSKLVTSGSCLNTVQVGEENYRAPEVEKAVTQEQIVDESNSMMVKNLAMYDSSADVYSYGIILWEIFADKKFAPRKQKESNKKQLPELEKITNSDIKEIIKKCLDFDTKERPKLEEILETIDRLLDDLE